MTNRLFALTLGVALAAACTDTTGSSDEDPMLLAVTPVGGTTGVPDTTSVTLEFSHAMGMHMEMYAALHEGEGVAGPIVDGMWTWSDDRTHLTFTPTTPLHSGMSYSIHIGGGMTDSSDHVLDLETHGHQMGGEWVTQHMMDQRTMGGMGSGMMNDMTGPGWRHDNGSYGMIFTFTTA